MEGKVRQSGGPRGTALAGCVLLAVVALLASIEWFATPVFDEAEMKRIAVEAIERTSKNLQEPLDAGRESAQFDADEDSRRANETIAVVVELLREAYGDRIIPEPQWMFNNAGGAMGSMLLLHCSLSEYIIIFGTAVGTEGHTGRFFADDFFTILHGQQWAFPTGSTFREVYKPGDQHHLRRLESKQYRMPESCWALEYARGNILSMVPFGLLDSFSSTMDLVSLYDTVVVTLSGMVRELLKGKV